MIQLVRWCYLLVLALWVGGIAFFSFIVAPTVFKTLGAAEAGRLQRALFPRYYLLGLLCAAAGILCVGWLLAEHAFAKWPGLCSLLLLAGMGATQFWLRQTILPRLGELHDRKNPVIGTGQPPDTEVGAEWKSLHALSVQLNAAVLICGLTLLFLVVFARAA